jgi:hypothetical protein
MLFYISLEAGMKVSKGWLTECHKNMMEMALCVVSNIAGGDSKMSVDL